MDVVFGLDVSTSIVGWSVAAADAVSGDLPLMDGYIDLRKIKDGFWAKVDHVRQALRDVTGKIWLADHKIVCVAIEDPVKKFKRGASSADTISLLDRFNALVSFFARSLTALDPLYLEVSRARNTIGLKLVSRKKADGLGHKEQTFQQLNETVFKDRVWDLNRNGKIQPYCWDVVDAFVIAMAGVIDVQKNASE